MTELAKRLALAAGGLGVALVLAELLLRLAAPIPYSMALAYEPDGHIAARLVRGRLYTLADGGRVTVNRLALRDTRDLTWEKPAGVVRVVALGGSSTFCFNTDDASIWTARLEALLRERFGPQVQVINAGQPAMSVFDSRFNYLYRIRELEPDVVLVYHGWNDLKLFSRIEAGDLPVWEAPYRPEPLRSFLRRFQLAWRIRALFTDAAPGAPPPRPETAVEGEWFRGERIPDGGRAHRWERRNYDDLARLVRGDGALPVFVGQASLVSESSLADPVRRSRIYAEYQRLPYAEVLRQLRAIAGIARASAQAHGGVFVDVYDQVPHDLDHFLDHVHLTPAGNEAVARALFRGLEASPAVRARLAPPGSGGPPAGAAPTPPVAGRRG